MKKLMSYKASLYAQLHTGVWERDTDTVIPRLQFSNDLSMGYQFT